MRIEYGNEPGNNYKNPKGSYLDQGYNKPMLTFTDYQDLASETAIYPDRYSKNGLMYVALGLASEAGEVAGKVKKYHRDGVIDKEALGSEVSDCLWYLSQLAEELQLDLGKLATLNIEKLNSRKERGVLGGSGDNR